MSLIKGALHESLGIPEGEHIPDSLLQQKLESTDDPILKKAFNICY